jgi:hypothetical protein
MTARDDSLDDPGNYVEVFACGLARIDDLGTCSRLLFSVPKIVADGRDGMPMNQIVLSLIVPTDQLALMRDALSQPVRAESIPKRIAKVQNGGVTH